MTSDALERLLRWEIGGGTWRVRHLTSDTVCVDLLTCDGGETMDTVTSTADDLIDHVRRRPQQRLP